ncbi:MAG TPA: hypothetical protein VLH12_08635 [Usitatibacter sp.]|nr:hypothetical protein [Usitatibacter sp.]
MKRIIIAVAAAVIAMAAHAEPGYFDKPTAPEPKAASENEPCTQSQAWTCTVQCDRSTRAPVERLFGAPGVEACVVLSCSCQGKVVQEGANINDPTLPIALVTFGVQNLLRRGPAP